MPLLLDPANGALVGYVNYGKLLHIDGFLASFGLKLTSTLLFEIGVAMTVFGGFSVIMEYTAHPQSAAQVEDLDDTSTHTSLPEVEG